MRSYGSQSMIAPLRTVLVKRPDASFVVDDPFAWHYTSRPDLERAQQEHDFLVSLLQEGGAEVVAHTMPQQGFADSIFVFDPVLITDQGAIILSMGKQQRRGEEAAMAQRMKELGIPILSTLHDEARAEGGDLLWLDSETLAVGQGFRTNAEGLRQLRETLQEIGVTVLPVELPYYTGPEACLHLLSLISIVDEQIAVVYPPLLAVPFWLELQRRNFRLIEVPETEFASV